MKRFFRSFTGKTCAFIICGVSLSIFLASLLAIGIYSTMGFYINIGRKPIDL